MGEDLGGPQIMALDVVIEGKSMRGKNCWRSNHMLLDKPYGSRDEDNARTA
jgi:hypothetical protein